jgi:hypothetical protein
LAAVGAAFFVVQGGVAVAGHSAPAAPTAPTIFEAQANLVQPGPFPQNKQNETSIAQNPKDPMNLVAGANDEIDEPACTSTGCPFVANVGSSGVYYSFDGGVTWTQFSAPRDGPNSASYNSDGRIHTLPGFGNLAAQLGIPGLASDGDPALAFSSGGTVYYASLAGVRGTNIPDLLTVSSSVDGGKHWSDPVLATDKTNPVDFNDKEAIWVDKSTSPFSGNVYLSWTLFHRRSRQSRADHVHSLDRWWEDLGTRPEIERQLQQQHDRWPPGIDNPHRFERQRLRDLGERRDDQRHEDGRPGLRQVH